MSLHSKFNTLRNLFRTPKLIADLRAETRAFASSVVSELEANRLLIGKTLAAMNREKQPKCLHEVEFSVFSQFGDDGIIQWLIANIDVENETFIEFGVEDYRESNTRFLLLNNNWRGLVMDGDPDNIALMRAHAWYWNYGLMAKAVFITKENINALLSEAGFSGSIGILSIDIDGMDYWVWEAINTVEPSIVIVEFNAMFGSDRAISVPYRKDFDRWKAHYSGLYGGASLGALKLLAARKGYDLVGTNAARNNAYFVKRELFNDQLRLLAKGFRFEDARVRECRNERGEITDLSRVEGRRLIEGLPVIDVESDSAAVL
jgi:hypothetical protein